MPNTAYILGSGPSINDYSFQQWLTIRKSRTMALNKWALFGLDRCVPDYLFVADTQPTTFPMLVESAMLTAPFGVRYCLPDRMKQWFAEYEDDLWAPRTRHLLPHRLRGRFLFRQVMPLDHPVWYRRACYSGCPNPHFALDRKQPLLALKGSLASAINLLWLLERPSKIVLVGVDLDKGGFFFTEELARPRWRHIRDQWCNHNLNAKIHNTADDPGAMQFGFSVVRNRLKDVGCELVSAAPSLLTKRNILKVEEIQ